MWLSAPASSCPRAVEGVAASGRSPCYFICATRSAADLNRLPKKATTSPMALPLPVTPPTRQRRSTNMNSQKKSHTVYVHSFQARDSLHFTA